jgi:hypothetical protein
VGAVREVVIPTLLALDITPNMAAVVGVLTLTKQAAVRYLEQAAEVVPVVQMPLEPQAVHGVNM